MASDNQVTLIGNLTDDPEIRFTGTGTPVANFTIANSKRIRDDAGNWKDGDTSFFRCSVWRATAENVAESLFKGMRVIVVGSLKQRSWEQDGQKRTVIEVDVEHVGPSLQWSTAKVTKSEARGERPAMAGASAPPSGGAAGFASAPSADDEPPF